VAVVQSIVGGSASKRILKTLCFEVEDDFFVQEKKAKAKKSNNENLNLTILSS
jgi:hypothetical protein